jgi:hypothetical protein
MRARLLEHAVAIGHEIGRIGIAPRNPALLQRIEPVVQDLHVRTYRVGGMGALNRMFMQKGNGRLNQLQLRGEEQRKAGGSRFAKQNTGRGDGGRAQLRCNLAGRRQFGFTNNLNHAEACARSDT